MDGSRPPGSITLRTRSLAQLVRQARMAAAVVVGDQQVASQPRLPLRPERVRLPGSIRPAAVHHPLQVRLQQQLRPRLVVLLEALHPVLGAAISPSTSKAP